MLIKIQNKAAGLIDRINLINPLIIIFLILCINSLSFTLSGNEENYFAWAKHNTQHDWIPNSFLLNEFAGSRIVYEQIVGFMLKFFSFEVTSFLGRLITCLFFAFPLARIFKKSALNNIETIFLLQVIFLPAQTFFADEFIFGSFESKTIAYIFAFWAYFFIFEEKYMKVTIFAILSTYFHILVGGWLFAIFGLYLLWIRYPFKKIFKFSLIYVLVLSPLVIYLFKYQILDTPKVINGVNLDWIYVYHATPFHLGITTTWGYFYNYHFPGFLLAMSFFAFCLLTFKQYDDKTILAKKRLLIIIFSIVLFSVLVSFIDRTGAYLKYYPFRKNSIAKFMVMLLISSILVKYYIQANYRKHLNLLILLISIPGLFLVGHNTVKNLANYNYVSEFKPMADYIKKNTDANSQFFVSFPMNTFHRQTNREQFFLWKYIPLGGKRIYEFYQRQLQYEKVLKDWNLLFPLAEKYQIGYLVSDKALQNEKLKEIFHNRNFHLYEIEK